MFNHNVLKRAALPLSLVAAFIGGELVEKAARSSGNSYQEFLSVITCPAHSRPYIKEFSPEVNIDGGVQVGCEVNLSGKQTYVLNIEPVELGNFNPPQDHRNANGTTVTPLYLEYKPRAGQYPIPSYIVENPYVDDVQLNGAEVITASFQKP